MNSIYYNGDDYLSGDGSSRPAIEAERIIKRIFAHNPDSGGSTVEILGAPGSGKTSLLLFFASTIKEMYPKEKIYWSDVYNAPIQSIKIGQDNWNLMVQKNSGITFHDRDKKLKQIYPELTEFESFADLVEKAKPDKINSIWFPDRKTWMDFISYSKRIGEWTHIFLDEGSEIFPSCLSGSSWHRVGRFANEDVAELRKCMCNLFFDTQSPSDCDSRVRGKITIRIMMPGSRKDRNSRIYQEAIDNLKEDHVHGSECFIEQSGKFGLLHVGKIYKPIPGFHFEAHTPFMRK
jgi:energy-coupling factor transporter ATP-binding protein EcfA2